MSGDAAVGPADWLAPHAVLYGRPRTTADTALSTGSVADAACLQASAVSV